MNIMIIDPLLFVNQEIPTNINYFYYITMFIILYVYILCSSLSMTCTHFHHYPPCRTTHMFILYCIILRYCSTFDMHCAGSLYSHTQCFLYRLTFLIGLSINNLSARLTCVVYNIYIVLLLLLSH